jgi:4-carboxymuconolactone decarboxylase
MHEDEILERGAEVLARLSPPDVAPPWESLADVAPALGGQVAHAFGTVMSGPELDLRTRELTTVAMLAALGGCEPQLTFHVGGALRAGATAPEIIATLTQVGVYAGIPRALNAVAVARAVFADAGVAIAAG